MTAVSSEKLTNDMRSHAQELVNSVGLVPQAEDRPLEAGDLLFYISETSMPMAEFLRQHGLFVDANGLNFDLTQFIAIRRLANSVIDERQAGDVNGVWKQLDLSTDEDADYNGTYVLTALSALELLYAPPV
ncbi:hypothetical protein FB548_2211 [Pseudoxanthomonas sp. 3HH-4]|uniref:hypothetical protein n=1 Tax=Pseudoxanthomonas sp. 3HH-4 TaxID=1690214 RepID=UPI001152F4AF|nr:hypothetical protein [Pseudoxanthomonas sp. 3HH-4]TQM12278.1 hypothetical protein FB548_2211 [Pseudoxanthomonas sp. 3HH-4]